MRSPATWISKDPDFTRSAVTPPSFST
jgi:hypothetical protein